jgi:hypothetical protein
MGELEHWQRLAGIAREMAAASASQDWDALIAHDIRFQETLSAIQRAASLPMGEAGRTEKARLIRGILADYGRVRDRVGPWMADVRPLLERWTQAERAA